MAISVTQTNLKKTTSDAPKTRNVYDNYDKLKSVVHYDANDNVEFVLKASNNASGKSGETKKLYQVHVDVVQAPTAVSFNTATLNGRIYKNDGSLVNEVGFIYWTGSADDNVIGKLELGDAVTPSILKGNFSKQLLNLSENTTYNYRAYVKHENGTNYSEVYQFTTISFSSVFSIVGSPNSGPAPLTVNLSAINAGTDPYTFGWNMTGGSISFEYSVSGITITNPGSSYELDVFRYTLNSITIDLSGAGYDPTAETVVLVNNVVEPSLSAEFAYNGDLAVYGISAVTIPAELSGYNVNTFTVTFSSASAESITEAASGFGSGSTYTIPREFSVLINDIPQPSLSVVNVYNEITDAYEISAIEVPAEIFGFTNSSRTVTILTNDPVDNPATATAQGGIQIIGDYDTQNITHTYLSAGQFTAKAYAILGDQVIKEASKQTTVTGSTGPINYAAQWSGVLGTYGNDVVGAYDFRNIPGSTLATGLLAFWKLDDLTDSSGNNRTLNNRGGVTFGPGLIGNGAIFDGGDSLEGFFSPSVPYGSGNFSISCWLKLDTLTNGSKFGADGTVNAVSINTLPDGTILIGNNSGNNSIISSSPGAVTTNQWYHICVVSKGGVVSFYLDNTLIGSNTYTFTSAPKISIAYTYGDNVTDGMFDAVGIWDRPLTTDEVQYLYNSGNGTEDIGKTVEAIVGPDLQLTGNTSIVTDEDSNFNDVSLLLHMDGTSGSTDFVDSSINAASISVFSNAQISTAQQKYGTGSGLFDGSGDYLQTPQSPLYSWGINDNLTMECWIYPISFNGSMGIIGTHINSFDSRTLLFLKNTGAIAVTRVGVNEISTGNGIINTGQWYHIAVTRVGGTTTIFVNGIQRASSTTAVWDTQTTNSIQIGYVHPSNGNTFHGYIDDVRITKKVARYVTNFTPPTTAFPDSLGNNFALQFGTSPAYAVANQTISVNSNPHTLVYVGKVNGQGAPREVMYIVAQPIKYSQTGNQNVVLFSRPGSGLLPYNGADNQYIGYNPNGTEWYYVALSFLPANQVRYAVRTPTVTRNGIVSGATHSAFNGFPMFNAGLNSATSYNGFGPVRLGMFINRAFSTEQEMNTLFAAITSGPVTDIDLIA